MSRTSIRQLARILAPVDAAPKLHDDIGPVYVRRAEQIASGEAHGDWPEVYLLAGILGCRIDVYWPLEDASILARYVVYDLGPALPRWCLLRESQSWTPLVGRVPNTDTWSADAAMDVTVVTPDGPDALFYAVATLCILMPALQEPAMSSAQLRIVAAQGLLRQAQLPYAQRDAALMQILAMTQQA